jgi:hypothetical protein
MKRFLFILFLLVFAKEVFPAFEDFKTGTRPVALGGAFTALSDDHNAPFWNPAGLTLLDGAEIYSTYKRLFGIVNNFTFTSCVPSKWGSFAFSIRESSVKGDYTDATGNVLMSNTTLEAERAILLSHGFHLLKEVSFGYNLVAYHLQNVRFGDDYAFGVDIGMQMEVYTPTIGETFKHPLPEEISLGLTYIPFENIATLLDFEKQLGYDINVKMGVEVSLIKGLLVLRGGVETEPVDFSLGFGTRYKNLQINYAFKSHTELPLTHLMEVGWEF